MPDRLLLPAFVALWTSGYVVGAVAIGAAGPLPLLALRFTLAAALLVPLALRHGRWRGAPLGRLALIGVLLHVVQFGGVYGGFALGVPAALSALVMLGLTPLVTAALAVAGGQERADSRLWAGLAIGVAGVAISLAPELGNARVGAGVGVTVLGMLGLSVGTVLQKRWAGNTDPRVSAAAQTLTAAMLVVPLALAFGGRLDLSLKLALSVAWLCWGMGGLSLLVLIEVLRRRAASSVAALLLVVPALTALASAPALGCSCSPSGELCGRAAAGGPGTDRARVGAGPRGAAAPGEPGRDGRGDGRDRHRAAARAQIRSEIVNSLVTKTRPPKSKPFDT